MAYRYNSTYSLDLSTSWSPKDVRFNMIDKGRSPVLNRPNLWPAPDGKSFYSFNGDVSQAGNYKYTDPPSTPQLWQFTPDGKNNGTWSLAGTASSLIQVQAASSTFGNGSAYILGGITNWRSTRLYGDDNKYTGSGNGIVSYSMNNQTWQNQSMAGAAPTGWLYEGYLHWVDYLGGSGLVVALGGVTAQPLPELAGETLVPFDYVSLFNPITGEWRNQSTTGAIPTPRRRGCSVGVPGDNGTYEVRAPLEQDTPFVAYRTIRFSSTAAPSCPQPLTSRPSRKLTSTSIRFGCFPSPLSPGTNPTTSPPMPDSFTLATSPATRLVAR